MTAVIIISVAAMGAALAVAVVYILRMTRQAEALRAEKARLETSLAVAEQRLQDERAMAGERFRALAAEALQTSARSLDAQSRLGLEAVLAPVRESIESFTRDFKQCYAGERDERVSLREGIENLAALNRSVGEETRRLTHALRGDKGFQGRWGEMILANVLEHSGLEEGRWVVYQHTETDSAGRRQRPDAVVTLPHGRKIVIDAKCSLGDWLRWAEADTDQERASAAKAHVQAIDRHVKTLSDKAYQDNAIGERADFTVMFMPHEGAFITAMQTDENLWQRAFDSRVVIASPLHLATIVKLVEQMWITDDRGTNARRIAAEAVAMLDKLNAAFDDLVKVGRQLDSARESYDSAIARLHTGRGNVARRAAAIAALGAKPSRPIPAEMAPGDDDTDAAAQLR